jgi:hypothetical protein
MFHNKIGEIRLLVIAVGDGLGIARDVLKDDTVAHQTAVDLQTGGQHGGEHRISGQDVAI